MGTRVSLAVRVCEAGPQMLGRVRVRDRCVTAFRGPTGGRRGRAGGTQAGLGEEQRGTGDLGSWWFLLTVSLMMQLLLSSAERCSGHQCRRSLPGIGTGLPVPLTDTWLHGRRAKAAASPRSTVRAEQCAAWQLLFFFF